MLQWGITMKLKIVMDSSGDLQEFSGVDFASAPLKIVSSEREFVDDKNLDVHEMVDFLKKNKGKVTTACPGVGEYLDCFGEADVVYCITITSSLSGSYNAASIAADEWREQHPDGKIHVFDSLSTGPEMVLAAEKIRDLSEQGYSFEETVAAVQSYLDNVKLLFALESLQNLVNNGRVSPAIAMIAGALGLRMIGKASEKGTLESLAKVRGAKKVAPGLLEQMQKLGYAGKRVQINHCENPDGAEALRKLIVETYPTAAVTVGTAGGLCSFYAERGGILVGFETK